MIGSRNSMVAAVRRSRGRYALAEVGKAARKRAEAKGAGYPASDPPAMEREDRVRAYANQTGWTTDFTPRQRRRLEKKSRRAQVRAEMTDRSNA